MGITSTEKISLERGDVNDCSAIAAQNPPMFDVLLDQARQDSGVEAGIAANG